MVDTNFALTTLQISDKFNNMLGFKIGSVYNKNLAIRNITLMRNIGKYKMYNIPMFPEIGTVYNVYERQLNRPVIHYDKGGLMEWNNDIVSNASDPSLQDDRTWFLTTQDKNGTEKEWFSTNSGSVGLSGGSALLKRVKDNFDSFLQTKRYLPEPYNVDNYDANNISHEGYRQRYKVINVIDVATNEEISPDPGALTGFEGRYITYNERNRDNQEGWLSNSIGSVLGKESDKTTYNKSVDYVSDAVGKDNEAWASSLLNKTNRLFKERKIESIIGRYFTDKEGEPKYSRGRNLRKEKYSYSNSFETPYCRVWTIHDNYCKVKNMIRPFNDGEKSLTIEEVQANYGEGYRPFGVKQLSNMTVLQSNGFVNIAPFHDDNMNLVEESVKKCMFSIENLAWKDIEFNGQVYRGKPGDYLKKNDDGTIDILTDQLTEHPWGSVLSKSQIGPNGGRIMWFPPYNIKFSENINTQWNDNSFIGRGEKIYTYVNTERSGTLSFTMLIDHPSVIDK